jgi:acyl-[acyl-carrier-protein] desaturase
MAVIEGFYAVEQYVPDYTAALTRLARRSYGQSQFQLRWGSEEARHAELWRNVLLFSRARTPEQMEQYTQDLRANAWLAPFDSPLHMLFYTVFQERATQVVYLNTARVARGEHPGPNFPNDRDPALARAIATIAIDEAAHYDFFLELARIHIYYFPEEALGALVDVFRNFLMPATTIVPNYDAFVKVLYDSRLFGPRVYTRDVAKPALDALGVRSVKAIEAGILRCRETPDQDGGVARRAPPEGCQLQIVESAVRRLFERFRRYEDESGLTEVMPSRFVAHAWSGQVPIPDAPR